MAIRIYLENGKTWSFATAVDWPGWSRRGKGEDGAIDALLDYRTRYAKSIRKRVPAGDLEVIARVGGSAMTEFGVPDAKGVADSEPFDDRELSRQVDILRASWTYFDEVVAGAPAALRKGPRGGGRDRDQIVDHVREAERAYGRKLDVRVPPRTPWQEQREALTAGLLDGADGAWSRRYALLRITWHVLDHAWEIEDKSA